MTTLPKEIEFGDTKIAIIDRDGRPWLAAADLARALGYADGRRVTQLYSRHADEFTDDMTQVIDISTAPKLSTAENNDLGNNEGASPTSIRIFSPRGCHLIAMLARTPRAKAFRRWVLDVLENLDRPAETPDLPPLSANSRFIPVRVDGIWHFLHQMRGLQQFSEGLYIALRPAAERLGLAWPATRDEVMTTREVYLSCTIVPRHWGAVHVGDELGRSLEPDHPIGPGVVTCIPLHELVPLAQALAPYPPVIEAAALLGERLLQGWHAHATGGILPALNEPMGLARPGRSASTRPAKPTGAANSSARLGPLTDEELAEMRRLCIEGETFQAISRVLGRSHYSVRWVLRGMAVYDSGLPTRAHGVLRGMDDEAFLRLWALRAEGHSLSSITREFGVPSDLLSFAFRGMDFARKMRQ